MEIGVGLDVAEFTGIDQRTKNGPSMAAPIAAGEEITVFFSESSRGFSTCRPRCDYPLSVARSLWSSRQVILFGEARWGDVVLVEGKHGAGIVVATWMQDPAACAALTVGES